MQVQRKNKELIIKMPEDVLEVEELQDLIDYLRFRSITAKSKASQKDIDEIAESIDKSWWAKNKGRFIQ